MGEVYRARDATLKRDVAIKVLPEFWSRDAERLRRFEREAQATAALNHPNIVSIFHVGQYDGSPYIVTELLHGETLRERLRKGPMRLREAIDAGIEIARGLAAAHDAGIVKGGAKLYQGSGVSVDRGSS
jgi:serine/threonine protein kinase